MTCSQTLANTRQHAQTRQRDTETRARTDREAAGQVDRGAFGPGSWGTARPAR